MQWGSFLKLCAADLGGGGEGVIAHPKPETQKLILYITKMWHQTHTVQLIFIT